MKIRTRSLFAVVTVASTVASMALFACATSSSETSGDDTPADDAGQTTDSGSKPKDGGTSATDGGNGVTDGGAVTDSGKPKDAGSPKDASGDSGNCDNLMARDAGAGVFCPFSTDAGSGLAFGNSNCAPGQICFRQPPVGSTFSINTCQATATDVDGGVNWECDGPSDCVGKTGTTCCGLGKLEASNSCATNSFVNSKAFRGTRCQATCNTAADEFTVCEAAGDCAGKMCAPFNRFGAILGGCL